MPEPITELPILESSLWEGIVVATAEGDAGDARELAEMLAGFGYEVTWERATVRLTHVDTGQQMEREAPHRPVT
jgi:hypothetical protein